MPSSVQDQSAEPNDEDYRTIEDESGGLPMPPEGHMSLADAEAARDDDHTRGEGESADGHEHEHDTEHDHMVSP
jgi:hypothetical protein